MRKALIVIGILAGLVSAGCLLLTYTPLGMFTIVFRQNPGHFDRKTMEAVVAQIRNAGLQPAEQREFVLGNLSDPKSLRPLKPNTLRQIGTGAGHVWAEFSADGKLKVVIETRDLGHAGEYGFAYSDVPLSPTPFDGGGKWLAVDVPGDLMLVQPAMKIDDHWWKVLNNLN